MVGGARKKHIRIASAVSGFVTGMLFVSVLVVGLLYAGRSTQAAWYNSDWAFRQLLTIQSSQVDATLTDFPVLITEANFATAFFSNVGQSDGSDIVFTASDGTTPLQREVVSFDAAGETMEIWVRVPTLSSTVDTNIYMYYGNTAFGEGDNAGTWNANYRSVLHFEEDPSVTSQVYSDSTSNSNDGTANGDTAVSSTGQIGNATILDGTADYIEINSSTSLNVSDITVSGWFRTTPTTSWTTAPALWMRGNNGGTDEFLLAFRDSLQDEFLNEVDDVGFGFDGNVDLMDAAWHHVALRYDGSTFETFVDGAQYGPGVGIVRTLNWGDSHAWIGADADAFNGSLGNFWNGLFDEMRINSTYLADGWISTEYNNQSSPGTFYALAGTAETTFEEESSSGDVIVRATVGEFCGNSVVETGEECDDGNTTSGDGCSDTCQDEQVCGNGTIETPEECDDGNTTSGDGCSATCTTEAAQTCGNGIVEGTEECDDGDNIDTNSCTNQCRRRGSPPSPSRCGNGVREGIEQCDDGNTTSGDGCSATCTTETGGAVCGNAILETPEQCDDGNVTPGDGCSATCTTEGGATCGNSIVETGEQCDDGNTTSGDGCSATCTTENPPPAVCGNAVVEGTEECDDGNTTSGDGCSALCQTEPPSPPTCGNSIVETGEQCDDGNTTSGDGCSATCTTEGGAQCGNGVVESPEQCDDGNITSGDGCSSQCRSEVTVNPFCGNGVVEGVEECDDGDRIHTNACDNNCRIVRPPDPPGQSCGNGRVEGTEQCDDGNRISGDGCSATCQSEITVSPQCGNGVVETGEQCDDGNQINSDGCTNTCQATGSPADYFDLNDVVVWLSNRTIRTNFVNRTVTDLTSDLMTFGIDRRNLGPVPIQSVTLFIGSTAYPFTYNAQDNFYYASITTPAPGSYQASIVVTYNQWIEREAFTILSEPYGVVNETGESTPLQNVDVALYDVQSGERIWPGDVYRQVNPQRTQNNGLYGFVVPQGTYRLEASRNGFRTRRTLTFQTNNNVINRQLDMIRRATVDNPVGRLREYTQVARLFVEDVVDVPIVEDAAQVIAPSAVGLSVAAVVPSLWSILWPLLRYLFLQPLLLLGKRKREGWGLVYSSHTKMPIDLAIVRLISATTKKVIQSRVTDAQGRFVFVAEPGTYLIEVHKDGFVAPSVLLQHVKHDGSLTDIYHGEKIEVGDEITTITPNIPMDPIGEVKTPKRIMFERHLRGIQHAISLFGIIITGISFYVTPQWYIGVFLALHILLYILFLRYVRPRKPKGWGIVYEKSSRDPLGRVVVRLFNKRFGKLIATQVTNTKGRYTFLVGPSEYYITYEKPGYRPHRTKDFTVHDQDRGKLIDKDVALEKKKDKENRKTQEKNDTNAAES